MYIKHNSMIKSIMLVSAFTSQAFEVVTDLSAGMQTNNRQLAIENKAVTIENIILRQELLSSLGYVAAEYLDFEFGVEFNLEDSLYIVPKAAIKFVNRRLDVGVKAAYISSIYDDSLRFSTFVDVYHSWYYSKINFSDSLPLEIDYGLQLNVAMNEFLDMRLTIVQPVVFNHAVNYKGESFQIDNRSNVSIGVAWHLITEYSGLQDEYLHIIQEPIAIPRINLVESRKSKESAMEMPISLPQDIEEMQEPMGWIAWIIEFIASLFRF